MTIKGPCDSCGSKDNLVTWDFEGKTFRQCKDPACDKHATELVTDGSYRGISKETLDGCNTTVTDKLVRYLYRIGHKEVGAKFRNKTKKEFFWEPNTEPSKAKLFLLDLWDTGTVNNVLGNIDLIITEGEDDALICQEAGLNAVSLPNGAQSARQSIQNSLPELLEFGKLILWFDNDAPGQEAVKVAEELLPAEKLRYVTVVEKDAQQVYENRGLEGIQEAVKAASGKIPEGLIRADQLDWDIIENIEIKTIPIKYAKLHEIFGGFDYGCMYMWLAGTGTGKTTVFTDQAVYYYTEHPKLKQALLYYEENEEVTPRRLIAHLNNIPVGKLRRDKTLLTAKQWKDSREFFSTDRLHFLRKTADRTINGLFKYLEYLITVEHVDIIWLDHISYIIGRTSTGKHGERVDIDKLVYKLQDFVQQVGHNKTILQVVSHIKESDSGFKQASQGGVPKITSGRGSRVLEQVPDGVIALARNIDPQEAQSSSILSLWSLKNRWESRTAKADELIFYEKTGKMLPR